MKTTVLIIDDQESIQKAVARALSGEELFETYLFASNGHEGFKYLCNNKVDLIFCDITMPECDGVRFLALWNSHPEYLNIPVLMLTSEDTLETKIRCLELGASDYVMKPFHAVELLSRARAHLFLKLIRDAQVDRKEHVTICERQFALGQIATQVAKDVSQPLTEILTAAKEIDQLSNNMVDVLTKLFDGVGEQGKNVQSYFSDAFSTIDGFVAQLKYGVSGARIALGELRGLTEVDGPIRESVNLYEFIHEEIQRLRNKGLFEDLEWVVDIAVEEKVTCNPFTLRYVVSEIFSYLSKNLSSETRPTIKLNVASEAGQHFSLRVSAMVNPIPKDELTLLTNPDFAESNVALTSKIAAVRRLWEDQRGQMEVEYCSPPELTFIVVIPRYERE